jgi:hypothetical protein
MNANASRLSGITKELWVNWQETKSQWRDLKSQQFEQDYLLELLNTVDKSVAVIEQLDKVIQKIRKDCE